jgi:hypothetical protein
MPADPDRPLTPAERMHIFRALVEAQDRGVAPERSRRMIASQFGLTRARVREIELEGIAGKWPPLS